MTFASSSWVNSATLFGFNSMRTVRANMSASSVVDPEESARRSGPDRSVRQDWESVEVPARRAGPAGRPAAPGGIEEEPGRRSHAPVQGGARARSPQVPPLQGKAPTPDF